MYPLLKHLTTVPLSAFLFVALLFQVTVHSQDTVNTFGIFPSPTDVPAVEEPDNPVVEQIPNENIDKGIMEVVQPATGDCVCVPYYLCNDDNTLNTDGTGIIDIRFGGRCDKIYYKCCNSVKNEDDNTRLNDQDKRVSCGHWNYKGVGVRIIGDVNNEAQFGEFPWMVAILKMDPLLNHTLCGGSLIHPQVVLTAFHCVHNKDTSNLLIRAGEWDLKSEDEHIPHQNRYVLKIIKHENYYGGASYNDIALIILTKKFILNENVGTICLPPQGYQFYMERCYVSGWGKNAVTTDYSAYQNILKKIDVPVVPQSTCLELLRLTRLGQRFKLHDSFMCAGGEIGKDACKGDGGSPLVCPLSKNPLQFQQAGIVAWGIGCGDRTPGVYVNVAVFRDWIDQHMDTNEMDKSYYDPDFNVLDTSHR